MPNEDIITALKNAIDKGEPLQQAIQIMISSGYDSREVQEASKFVGQGITPNLEPRPDEQLIMSQNKKGFNKLPKIPKNQPIQQTSPQQSTQQQTQPTQPLPQPPTQQTQQTPLQQQTQQQTQQSTQQQTQPMQQTPTQQLIQEQTPSQQQTPMQQIPEIQSKTSTLQTENQKIEPTLPKPKKSYLKEIILVAILLILVGVLITTIFLKDQILGFFS